MHRDVSRGDVPLPACLGVRDLVASNSQRRSRLLIFLGGANVFVATLFCNRQNHLRRADVSARPERTSRSLGAEDKLRPAIRPGARSAVRPTALLGFQSLRRFAPDREWRDVSICRACMPFLDSFAAINFRRGIGRLEGETLI
jgi:hypothetical protein